MRARPAGRREDWARSEELPRAPAGPALTVCRRGLAQAPGRARPQGAALFARKVGAPRQPGLRAVQKWAGVCRVALAAVGL
eukprot:5892189-Alexandrium_andersonii.AAC.1